MSKTLWTPGPWWFVRGDLPRVMAADGVVICGVHKIGRRDDLEAVVWANGAMLSAALALYEALETARGYVEKVHGSLAGAMGADNLVKSDLDMINAALAKARGEKL